MKRSPAEGNSEGPIIKVLALSKDVLLFVDNWANCNSLFVLYIAVDAKHLQEKTLRGLPSPVKISTTARETSRLRSIRHAGYLPFQ